MTTRTTAPPPQCQHRTRIPGTGRSIQCQLTAGHTGQHVWHEPLNATTRGTNTHTIGALTARWTVTQNQAPQAPTRAAGTQTPRGRPKALRTKFGHQSEAVTANPADPRAC
jgi:hypothetical protein